MMSKFNFRYTAKPIEIEAFKPTEQILTYREQLPDWIYSLEKTTGSSYFVIKTSSQKFEVKPGQWLVRHETGLYQIMDNDFFNRRYLNQNEEVK